MKTITLTLPIQIRPTVGNDGYVITDGEEIEHFFYKNEGQPFLVYDGYCMPFLEDNRSEILEKVMNDVQQLNS